MARPFLIPALERVGRFALKKQGITSHYVETPLGRIHVYDGKGAGSLPTLCVMHGFGSSATAFGRVLGHLARDVRRIVAPDMSGHGLSEAPRRAVTPDLLFDASKRALDERIDEPMVLMGNSLGGAFAIKYALASPAKVRALVLVSPGGASMEDADLQRLLVHFRMKSNGDSRAFLDRLYHKKPWFSPLIAGEVRQMFGRKIIQDFLDQAKHEDTFREDELAGLAMPILFIWGKSERLLPPESHAFFRRALPEHTRFLEPDGMAHCPHLDDPQGLAALVTGFVRELPG